MQGNQNRSCGPLMRLNCCWDSQSTTRRVGCKKGSISSAARTRACSPPLLLLLLLLLWDVAAFRGRRLEVKGWGDGVIVLESMRIHCPHGYGRAAFPDFSTLRPFSKKCIFRIRVRFCTRAFSSGRALSHLKAFIMKQHYRKCCDFSSSNSWISWKWTRWNSKTQQMFDKTNRKRETEEIQLEAAKVLRAQRLSVRFPAQTRVEYWFEGEKGVCYGLVAVLRCHRGPLAGGAIVSWLYSGVGPTRSTTWSSKSDDGKANQCWKKWQVLVEKWHLL